MTKVLDRARVVLSAGVTWMVLAATVLTFAVDAIGEEAGDTAAGQWLVMVLGGAITVLGVAVAIIRRVTPVLPAERGILPPDPPPGG